MAEIGNDIEKAKYLLEQGELVAIPTETVYGLAANALNVSAVTKIFEVKNRPHFDPLIVHVPHAGATLRYVTAINDKAKQLANAFWPGPLTLLLEKQPVIPDLVTSGLPNVGIRCPAHPLTGSLLEVLDFPLAAPSANPFGYVSPTRPEHVEEQLGSKIAYILDGGVCEVGLESTIVGFDNGETVVYRMGGLSIESIQKEIGNVRVQVHSSSNPKAPGQLQSHYAPGKKLVVGKIEELLQLYPAHESGLLTFNKDFNSPYQIILSPTGKLEEAAQNLFTALRGFDKMPIEVILAEFVPDVGLGKAINDRLRRASAGR
ncbi:L-threonylcarbamoyladenylate synthase [Chryseosolibacter indicus]|uniref:Threonylcarbamoyl-AMP synthase n=1 Tax=Chryseosolibacter indicus TaxID=2782351 RepID=A0ABS5VNY5_9BACT|nr:L-threonylcarbamoyladenylate synthase [Chryseosolibacter indicus]MBT1702502.1 threonylcarbamoyl-AMP synthase [Chryseosolibacter indicus]